MSDKKKYLINILISFLIILTLPKVLEFLSKYGTHDIISFSLYSEKGGKGYIYINNDWVNPVVFDVRRNQINNYKIPSPERYITNIRIDPSDSLGDLLKISNFEIRNGDLVTEIKLKDIYSWGFVNIINRDIDENSIIIRGNSKTPVNINGSIPKYRNENGLISDFFNLNSEKILIIIILSYIILLNLKSFKNTFLLIILTLIIIDTFSSINEYFSKFTNVNQSVGRSIITNGISALGNQVGIVSIFLFSGLLALVISLKKYKNIK